MKSMKSEENETLKKVFDDESFQTTLGLGELHESFVVFRWDPMQRSCQLILNHGKTVEVCGQTHVEDKPGIPFDINF
jgi:hypothetical protein